MRRQTGQGSQDPRNDTVTSSVGFLSASEIPDLEPKKLQLATQKSQWAQKRQNSPQSLLSLVKGLGKEPPSRTEPPDSKSSTPAEHHWKNCGPNHISKGHAGIWRLPFTLMSQGAPTAPPMWDIVR